ncbi:adenine-specific methyltransferase EcoRI family protein [Glaesserella parasuis]|uniref:Adenine-specific methyltransferase EcoRI family protein n=1 Tax=Glaesserella parasuis TaxID=738 RepID=A0A1T0A175_GLAPU|nr:adenine-specific methyltransferase EcoRI family protein [Glaesserella parasuis]MCT8517455.1 adenine-specific methyltransferase EcoRI family protein [Glaesserella parasuis]MCT8537014.1 adenine-specific methyltransferase EcoRI family protein [Glaesserella parasuis]MCT8542168.1 adenine-specific methyltransferase EcoRI family protein [Glaesserella parasuis]MCT8556493.1 adenine-specific methyltransferase EcoRI family protein [Glaesserella parasuis]MCT8568341.1 adenine-specific methyltransferase 
MAGNKNLHRANREKNDEFYTQLVDIENELRHYTQHFKDKIIFCNCDDPEESNFFRYFALNFEHLGIKKLIATHFDANEPTYKLEIDRELDLNTDGKIDFQDIQRIPLQQNGDFRSPECIEILKQSDIVVTNPPFSLFREYVAQLMEYEKKFVIVGNQNAITYKETFKLIKENKIWLGNKSGDMAFRVPDYYEEKATRYWQDETGQKWRSLGNICWFTNLDHAKRHEELLLYKAYSEEEYPKYDNYDAIEVNKVKDIPFDYQGAMGVPITFMDKYNPDQFEILSANDFRISNKIPFKEHGLIKDKDGTINGKPTYVRIVIKHKR